MRLTSKVWAFHLPSQTGYFGPRFFKHVEDYTDVLWGTITLFQQTVCESQHPLESDW